MVQTGAEKNDVENNKKDEVKKQREETVNEQVIAEYIQKKIEQSSDVNDWALESLSDPDDPLFKTQLSIKQRIVDDCSLNNS